MGTSRQFLNPSQAAKRLGISAKALRLYEQRGLIAPIRSAAGPTLSATAIQATPRNIAGNGHNKTT